MDPNETLKEMRTLAKSIIESEDDHPAELIEAVRLAEAVEAMDGWLKGKGFLPKEWAPTDDCPECGREATVQTSCCKCGAFV